MAIRFVEELTASPNPAPLPVRIGLSQVLDSTRGGGEAVTFEYSLEPGHNVWFKGGDGELTKTISREGRVDGRTEFTHRANLVERRGEPLATLEIAVSLESEYGTRRSSACAVAIKR